MDYPKIFNIKRLVIVFSFIVLIFPKNAFAEEGNFVTIINPVRISPYTKVVSENIKQQYETVKSYSFPATWIITFDILNDEKSIQVLKSMDQSQEIGLFLEIGKSIADNSQVAFNQGKWHDPSVVFLSGYSQVDRKKFIDTYFEKYKEIFGVYPETVGSWWADSYSLSYMKEKYNINTNLTVSDQFSTDEYRVWGTYWSTPYYPSKTHSGVPAQEKDNKLDIVMLQWASREPYNGYNSSLYSTQDYFVLKPPQKIDYFEYLLKTYAFKNSNQFGQMVVGLEADFSTEAYTSNSNFGQQLSVVQNYRDSGGLSVVSAKDFTKWYKEKFNDVSPVQIIKADNFFNNTEKVVWYNSPFYRFMARSSEKGIDILDFRVYQSKSIEPYYYIPNFDNFLNINISSVIDTTSNSNEKLKLNIKLEDLNLQTDKTNISELDKYIFENSLSAGYEFRALSLASLNNIKSKKFILVFLVIPLVLLSILFIKKKGLRVSITSILFIYLFMLAVWINFQKESFYVSSDEVSALNKLKFMERGEVLVINSTCLQCVRIDGKTPAVYQNKKEYVEKLSNKNLIFSDDLSLVSRENARQYLSNLGVEYIYLVSIVDFSEKLPYSPGDWNVELVFDNANAQIWKVKK